MLQCVPSCPYSLLRKLTRVPSAGCIAAGFVLVSICSYFAFFDGLGTNLGMTCYVLAVFFGTLSVVGVIAWSMPDVKDEVAVEADLKNHYWSGPVGQDGRGIESVLL